MNRGEAVSIPPPFAKSAETPARARAGAIEATAAAAAAIGIGAIAVRLAFGVQLDGLDDAGYLDAAQRVADGRSLDNMFALFRTRVGMSYPLGALVSLGWLEPTQFRILTLIAETITIVSLCIAGRLWGGSIAAGAAAAALYAIYPLAVQQSSMYYPTAFQVASIAAACALLAIADRRSARGGLIPAAAAGVSLGIGYLFKEDVAIVVVAIALASLLARVPRLRITFALCAGAALVFFIECACYWWLTGDPLSRLSATSGLGAPLAADLQIAEIWRWDAYPRSLLLLPVATGLMWWLLVPALWTVWRAGGPMRFVAVLFVIVMAYLQFGSGSFTSYSPLPKTPRYTALATPLVMLLVGSWLASLLMTRPRAARAVAALVLAAALPAMFYLSVSSSERTRNTMAVLPLLQAQPAAPLYTDYYSARVLRLLHPERDIRVWYHADFKTGTMQVLATPASGALALLDRQAAKVYTSSYELALPPVIDRPDDQWLTVWAGRAYDDGSLARRVLEAVRAAAARLPAGNPLSSRIDRNMADMIDGDQAALYRVR